MKRGDTEYTQYIKEIVDGFAPFTEQQKQRLGSLLRPGVVVVWKAIREREAAARRNAKNRVGGRHQ